MKQLFLTVLGVSGGTTAVILAVLLFSTSINRRFTARWKYWIWIALAVRLLIPWNPSLTSSPAAVRVELPDAAVDLTLAAPASGQPSQGAGQTAPAGLAEETEPAVTAVELASWAWASGAVLFLGWQTAAYHGFRRRIFRWSRPVAADGAVASALAQQKAELGVTETVRAVVCRRVASPMTFGFFRPVLVLPREDYAGEELAFILRHELTHCRRRDIWYKALMMAANAVHWFNPVVWWMAREAARDLELSCDAAVVSGADAGARRRYSEVILAGIRRESLIGTPLSTHFYGGKNTMKERFANILSAKKRRTGAVAFAAVLLCVALVGGLVACGAKSSESPSDSSSQSATALTQEQIDAYNAGFTPTVTNAAGVTDGNPVCCFFTSEYTQPKDLDFAEFMRYFPGGSAVTDQTEFDALKASADWTFGADATLDNMPVPIHKYTVEQINAVLQQYAGITVSDLSKSTGFGGDLIYLKEYDAYYNFTSDAGWGMFTSTDGEAQDGIVKLYSRGGEATMLLTLKDLGDGAYQILSFGKAQA